MKLRTSLKLRILLPALALCWLAIPAFASPVTYPGPVAVDDTGAKVSPTSITVASVTDLDGNAIASPGAVAHVAGSNTSVVYDAAAKGEAWITLTPVLSGHTFVNTPPVVFCSVDSSLVSTTSTQALANASALSGLSAKIGTPTGASVVADIASALAAVNALPARILIDPTKPLYTTATGYIRGDLAQPLDATQTGDTLGGGLIGARAEAFGKTVISGTPGNPGATLKIYAADGSTVLKTYDLSTSGTKQ